MFKKSKFKIDRTQLKENRFKRIAGRRVQEIINKLRLLGNCANTGNYSYTTDQVKKIFRAIDDEWKRVKLEYNKGKKNQFRWE